MPLDGVATHLELRTDAVHPWIFDAELAADEFRKRVRAKTLGNVAFLGVVERKAFELRAVVPREHRRKDPERLAEFLHSFRREEAVITFAEFSNGFEFRHLIFKVLPAALITTRATLRIEEHRSCLYLTAPSFYGFVNGKIQSHREQRSKIKLVKAATRARIACGELRCPEMTCSQNRAKSPKTGGT